MASYSTRDFEKAISEKGFTRDKSHHFMYWYYLDGKKTSLRTRTSHGETSFDDSMLAMRQKQIGNLTKQQMIGLIQCPFTAEQLRQHLLDTGRVEIPRDPQPQPETSKQRKAPKRK